jgi:hypothetical protein
MRAPWDEAKAPATLRDAAHYITKLPKAEHEGPEWHAATRVASGRRAWRPNDARQHRLGTIPSPQTCHGPMTENPFHDFDLEHAIALRWALRDIKAKRLKLSPVSAGDLHTLLELGLVEMRDDAPVLTNAGHAVLD